MFKSKKAQNAAGPAVGIDISGSYLSIIEMVQATDSISVKNFDVLEMAHGASKEETILQTINFLKEAFSRVQSKDPKVYCVLSGSEVVIRRVSLRKMRPKDLREAIKWEIKSHVPFPIDNAVINFRPIGQDQDKASAKQELLVTVVQQRAIDETRSVFEAAGIKLDGITVAPFAVWEVLREAGVLQKDKTTSLMNIGSDTTKISFFRGDMLEFYRELPLAGNSFTKAMIGQFVADKWQMNMDYAQAEKTKRLYGIPDQASEETTPEGIPLSHIYQVIRPALRRFINEVARSFGYYKEQFGRETVDRVLISGGASKMKNIEKVLGPELESTIERLDTLVKAVPAKPEDEERFKDCLPHLMIALGAALSRCRDIDLLKEGRQSAAEGLPFGLDRLIGSLNESGPANRSLVLASSAGLLVVLLAAVYINMSIDSSISYCKRILDEKKVILANIKVLSEKKLVLTGVEKSRSPVRLMIAELTNLLPRGVLLETLSFSGASRGLQVTGTCRDIDSSGMLLKNIERSPMFGGASLVEAKRTGDGKQYDFRITFRSDM